MFRIMLIKYKTLKIKSLYNVRQQSALASSNNYTGQKPVDRGGGVISSHLRIDEIWLILLLDIYFYQTHKNEQSGTRGGLSGDSPVFFLGSLTQLRGS